MHTVNELTRCHVFTQTDMADCHGNLEAKETELEGVRGDLEQCQMAADQRGAEVEQLKAELGRVSVSEEKLTQKLAAKDKKLSVSEERLSEEKEKGTRRMQLVSKWWLAEVCHIAEVN